MRPWREAPPTGESAISKKKIVSTPALAVINAAGVDVDVIEYDHSASMDHGYAKDTAQVLGVREDLVYKTLVVDVGDHYVMALVPAHCRLNLKAVAHEVGAKRASLANPRVAEKLTGYVTGGISPLGGRTAMQVLLDEAAMSHERIMISGGSRSISLLISPRDLLDLSNGSRATISTSSS